jgi:predicted methyltransferase MtxX (methanogen marker protein 4)
MWNKDKFEKKLKIMLKLIQTSAEFLKKKLNFNPEIGIILGTGLGRFSE